jgi:hypothetical protein
MSDGPHRSLPMKRRWQSVAERACNHAFGMDEISAAMIPALAGDCQDELSPRFIERIRGICEEQETLLIKDDAKQQFEALREDAGTGIGRRVLENVERLSREQGPSVSTLVKGTEAAILERAARSNRQIEEHILRKSTATRAIGARTRLDQATGNAPISRLARQVLKLDSTPPSRPTDKRDGLDEGPSIR